MAKYLGIDYGAKRIGLATASDDAKVATPLPAIGPHEFVATIEREGPFVAVVVGLPRGLDGQETPQTLAVRRFCDDVLWRRLHIEAVFQDEAGTSELAAEHLRASGRPFAKADIDSAAAAIILQDYLDTI